MDSTTINADELGEPIRATSMNVTRTAVGLMWKNGRLYQLWIDADSGEGEWRKVPDFEELDGQLKEYPVEDDNGNP